VEKRLLGFNEGMLPSPLFGKRIKNRLAMLSCCRGAAPLALNKKKKGGGDRGSYFHVQGGKGTSLRRPSPWLNLKRKEVVTHWKEGGGNRSLTQNKGSFKTFPANGGNGNPVQLKRKKKGGEEQSSLLLGGGEKRNLCPCCLKGGGRSGDSPQGGEMGGLSTDGVKKKKGKTKVPSDSAK